MKNLYNAIKQMFVKQAENIDHNKTVFGCGLRDCLIACGRDAIFGLFLRKAIVHKLVNQFLT